MGIRGGTSKEILKLLDISNTKAIQLEPKRLEIKDDIDLWYKALSPLISTKLRKMVFIALKCFKKITGVSLTTTIFLAIRKG